MGRRRRRRAQTRSESSRRRFRSFRARIRVSQQVNAHLIAPQPTPKPVTRERKVYRADLFADKWVANIFSWSPIFTIKSRVRLGRSTMACFNMAGLHAVARMPTCTARSRRPFQTTRATLDDARQPSALAGFVSRRVKPHALRHTEQSIWNDQTRRHGRALRDTQKPRRWAMTPSNEFMPSEGEAARNACVPRRCVLPLSSLVYV